MTMEINRKLLLAVATRNMGDVKRLAAPMGPRIPLAALIVAVVAQASFVYYLGLTHWLTLLWYSKDLIYVWQIASHLVDQHESRNRIFALCEEIERHRIELILKEDI